MPDLATHPNMLNKEMGSAEWQRKEMYYYERWAHHKKK
jgi:hypothetical protein